MNTLKMPRFTANASLYKTRSSYRISYELHQMPDTNRVLPSLMVDGGGRPNPCREACKCCIHTRGTDCCAYCDDCLDWPTLGDRGTFTLG
jgi:hypothetical protein